MKHFQCESGKIYELPDQACIFCINCSYILWDYTHGIYNLYCDEHNKAQEFGNVPCICKDFKADLISDAILENRKEG